MRSNSEHKVLAAWLNTLQRSGDSLCAKSNGADLRDFWKKPSVGFHVGIGNSVMLNLEGVENFSVTNMLSTPLTTEIEDVDSVTEICSKCNSGYIHSLGSADTIEMVDAILQSLCLSCSSGVTQTENIVIEDLDIVGSSILGKCGGPGHHNCKSTREPEKDNNGVSLCASSNKLGSDKVVALNPMQFLPHFLFTTKTGSNDPHSSKSSLPALKATSTEGNVKFVTPKASLPKNPAQLLPHMIQLSDNTSSEPLSCSYVVEPVKDDRINYYCKEKMIETDELQSCAEQNSIDTQLLPVMKPVLSKSRRPKHHLKSEVVDSLEQPLGCEKLEEIVIPVNRNLSNPRSGCDRWSLQGVSSRLKASLRHLKSSYFCDKMWYKYSYIQHIHELDKAVGRRFTLFAFPMESLEQDVIYSTTADVVAFGKTSKRSIYCAKTEAKAERFYSTAHERRPRSFYSRQRSGCIFASISNKLHKPDIRMSRWWDDFKSNTEEAEYDMLLESVAQSMPNGSNARRVPAAPVIDVAAMSKLYMSYLRSARCHLHSARCRSGVDIVISAPQSLLLNSVRKSNPLWSKHSCNFRWRSCTRKMM